MFFICIYFCLGWFDFGQSIAGIIGALAMGYLAELSRF
jgi:hypothetical protein